GAEGPVRRRVAHTRVARDALLWPGLLPHGGPQDRCVAKAGGIRREPAGGVTAQKAEPIRKGKAEQDDRRGDDAHAPVCEASRDVGGRECGEDDYSGKDRAPAEIVVLADGAYEKTACA